jgi:DNA-binding CsgD family transcriptional regulator
VSLNFTPPNTPKSGSGADGLSPRQLEIMGWVHKGKSASDIAGILSCSARTVETHIARACERLEVKTRFQAVLKLLDMGLLEPES